MITLGQQVRDKVTGFTGIATTRIQYLNGCIQYGVKPRIGEDGKLRESEYFDEAQLEVVGEGLTVPQKTTGGPVTNAPRDYRG